MRRLHICVCVEYDDVCAIVWVSWRRGGRGRRSRTLRALASAARRARVVRDIRRDWNCHTRDYTRPQNVK